MKKYYFQKLRLNLDEMIEHPIPNDQQKKRIFFRFK